MLKINLPETFKLALNADKTLILVSNRAGTIVHEMDAINMPHIVDYILGDGVRENCTFVSGFIEDNLLVIIRRAAEWT